MQSNTSQTGNNTKNSPKKTESRYRVNKQIRSPNVRVIDESGSQIGILSTSEAMSLAYDKGLDLVEVNGMSNPPVCKLVDYGKFLYQEKQKEKENRKPTVEVKELYLKPNICTNDLKTKASNVTRWLTEGNKTKVVLQFSGREMERANIVSKELMKELLGMIGPHKVVEQPKMDGKKCIMYLEKA